ncbi:Alpha/Beta hydrolase protein [Roridomyces roridus]|uniref:Alpha/Beta hydrolase protein n=1 Tax=Roridomyces roridus TaxID=1738132 RepID=A0AAD7FKJ7_9AGAR|nr:Alpha/Beta hydrolase protein [Roridomyces roridus]
MSVLQLLWMLVKLVPMPAVVLWKLLTTLRAPYNKNRNFKRIICDCAFRYVASALTVPEIRAYAGTTLGVYTTWAKKAKIPPIVDEIGGGARLLWVGPKRLGDVILFLHGGGFAMPPHEPHLLFLHHVRTEMERKRVTPGIAMLNYSLWPESTFPTPLTQLCLAVEFLLVAGVDPQRLQLVGDSAGGNIIVQLLSHMLHPHPSVPVLNIPGTLRSAHLISPWVDLRCCSSSWSANSGIDYVSKEGLGWVGARVASSARSETDRIFIHPILASRMWFSGLPTLVSTIRITAGEKELMVDDILALADILREHHGNVEVVVQEGGFHEDMFLDFLVGERTRGGLMEGIVASLVSGCAT